MNVNASERILPRPALVASLAPRDLSEARELVSSVPAEATALEIRLDLAAERIPPGALLALDPRPVIATWRTTAEGGAFSGSGEEYRRLLEEAYSAGASIDVEHSSGLLREPAAFPDRNRVVVSSHSPFALPADWAERLDAMRATGARAAKLVAGAADLATSLRIAAIQADRGDDSLSVFPMGPASPPGRILSALFGAALVFGSVGTATAGGQLALAEMVGVYGVHRPRSLEALYGIVGQDVAGSLSPAVHNALFRARGLPFLYLPLPVADYDRARPENFAFDPAFRGFSVTHPWKRSAARAGIPSEDVRATGAANTLVLSRRRWRAENTDVDGIFEPLADHDTGEGRTAVVLGAGGVARAAIVAARKLGYEVLVAGRRDSEADALADELRVDSLSWEDVARSEADLYVNATPIGSRPGDPPAVPPSALEHRPLIFDCVYRKDGGETPTIAAARAARCPSIEGLQMFAAQALRQARLFGADGVTLQEIRAILAERA